MLIRKIRLLTVISYLIYFVSFLLGNHCRYVLDHFTINILIPLNMVSCQLHQRYLGVLRTDKWSVLYFLCFSGRATAMELLCRNHERRKFTQSLSKKTRKFLVAAVALLLYAALAAWFFLSSGVLRFAAMLSIILFAVFIKLIIRLLCKVFKIEPPASRDQ